MEMLLHAHKGFAYLILLLTVIFVFALFKTMFSVSGNITSLMKKSTTFTMIFFHVQALLGIIMLFTFSGAKDALDSGTLMKDGPRQLYIEHPFSMIVAAVLLTILNKKLKTADRLSVPLLVIGIIAVALFASAFPWAKVFVTH